MDIQKNFDRSPSAARGLASSSVIMELRATRFAHQFERSSGVAEYSSFFVQNQIYSSYFTFPTVKAVFRLAGALRPIDGGGHLLNVKSRVNKNQTGVIQYEIFLFEIVFAIFYVAGGGPKVVQVRGQQPFYPRP